jgi:hypothetical protein
MKHSPGPWKRGNAYGAAPNHAICADYVVVARVVESAGIAVGEGKRTPYDHGDANARLIAAAPDLLAALQNVVNSIALHGDGPELQHDLYKARQAISRATGPGND